MIELSKKEKAYFHLPGLFEFYELYKVFLPLFYHHREYFYDWCEIGSIYGSPEDCLWERNIFVMMNWVAGLID